MKQRYHITGMTCSACSSHVEKSCSKLDGVERASVNLLTETMDIVYDEKVLTETDIVTAVEKAGYGAEATGSSLDIRINGPRAVGKANGADADGFGTVPDAGKRGTINDRGNLKAKANAENRAMKWRLGISIGFLIPLMYVAMYHMYNEWFGLPIPSFVHNTLHGNENAINFALTQFLLLLPILYVNRKFFEVGFKTLIHLSPNMDSLIALGSSAAVGYGIFAMYRISYGLGHGDMALVEHYSHDLYFESAGMILTLITVGKYLESRSKGKTSEAITKLMDLSPKMAVLLTENGEEREVPTESLKAGDIFLIKPGVSIPVDGEVLEGTSSVDESAITGESVPVEKQAGDKVVSATINKVGFLKCKADRVGEDTTLAQIIRLVEEASASKAPIARLADKVAGVFVPIVIIIALVTLAGWLLAGADMEFAISSAIAVLVISCPCALGLATPVAIMVGTGVGASHGILIKSGEALQQAKGIDTVVLDKTGTITAGELRVKSVGIYVSDMPMDCFIQIAAALEKKSEHPLAEAIVEYAEREHLTIPEVTNFKAAFGRGVEGVLAEELRPKLKSEDDGPTAIVYAGKSDTMGEMPPKDRQEAEEQLKQLREKERNGRIAAGTRFYVGNVKYLEENGITVDEEIKQGLAQMSDEGMTPLLVADENRVLGNFGVTDTVKPSSLAAIQAWHKMGVHVIMLTGDNKRTAEAVRQELMLEEVIAEVLPQDKEKKITALKQAGHKVAMIGDGINDAPALAAADVGMAIGAGTDVAMESADIVLMKSDLRDAVTAMKLSRAVIRNIKQNLFWAFFYNSIGIPLAAGLLYPVFQIRLNPMFGAAAMSLSSIFVVGNALRLRGFKSGFREFVRKADCVRDKQSESTENDTEKQTDRDSAGECTKTLLSNESKEQENKKNKVREKANEKKEHDKKENEKERNQTMIKTVTIEGMMCGHCTGRVQKALEGVDGVNKVTMSLENKTATVEIDGDVADEALSAVVTEAGYEVTGVTTE